LEHFPKMLVVQGEDNKRRLRIQIPKEFPGPAGGVKTAPAVKTSASGAEVKTSASRAEVKTSAQTKVPLSKQEIPVTKSSKAEEAIAIPHPEYPDTYELLVNGVKKGYAAIQDIDLSKRLRSFTQKEIRVKIEWNSEFSMYEICDII
jgi:hypothetical protein